MSSEDDIHRKIKASRASMEEFKLFELVFGGDAHHEEGMDRINSKFEVITKLNLEDLENRERAAINLKLSREAGWTPEQTQDIGVSTDKYGKYINDIEYLRSMLRSVTASLKKKRKSRKKSKNKSRKKSRKKSRRKSRNKSKRKR